MRRRAFITLLGGGTAAWTIAARAQQTGKLPTIGFLGTATAAIWSTYTAAFVERLRELGWIEGRTVAIEYRWADGRPSRAAEIAVEFARLKVDVILTAGSSVSAILSVTPDIPIVFASATDPVADGLVRSLSRPGGNVTGLSNLGTDLAGKRFELLREAIPRLRRLAILFNGGYTGAVAEMTEVEVLARRLNVDVVRLEIRRVDDIAPAFQSLNGQADALYLVIDGLVAANRTRILIFALTARLPTVVNNREHAEGGALLSYGANFPDLFRRAGEIVNKILRGAKPADIPVEQATKFDFIVNLTTAKALGLDIPTSLLSRANELIE
jgi:putative ABC transport system substrate-binding protein